jgi:hypothetical protein
VIDFTGPQRAGEDSEPLVTSRRARHGNRRDDPPDEPEPGRRGATRRSREAEPDEEADTSRSRRRVGWRKGTDVDEELWPTEAFGGVSDEQFWDDLAADKPLTTTARTAQPEAAAKRRPPNAGPLPDLRPVDDRGRGDGVGGRGGGWGGAAEGPGTYPQPRLAADDRTAESRGRSRAATSADEDPLTSPAYSLRPRGSVDGRAYPSSRRSRDLSREQYEAAAGQETQSFSLAEVQAAGGGYPDGVPPLRQFDRPSHGTNGAHGGRGRSDAGRSDPLRSDGYRPDPLRADPLRTDPLRADPLRPDPLRSGDAYGGSVPSTAYPYQQQPYSQPGQSMSTPPYGERYGYGSPAGPASSGGDPRLANGGWGPGRPRGNGTGDGGRGARPVYPPTTGYRGPYDPQGYDRRLSSPP